VEGGAARGELSRSIPHVSLRKDFHPAEVARGLLLQKAHGLLPTETVAGAAQAATPEEVIMSVFQVNGVYHYRFCHRGEVIRRSTRQSNYRTALAMEAAHRTAKSKGEAGLGEKPASPTLSRFLVERVRPWAEKQKPTTATWYRSGINPLLAHAINDCQIDAITTETIADFRAQRESEGRAVGTINRELRVLRRCLRLAVEWGIIALAPKVVMAGAEVQRERVVKDDEFARYLQHASHLLADVAIILNETGLRPDECHRLEWQDVDFLQNRLLVRHGKTRAARRQLPMTRNVRSVLETRLRVAEAPEIGYVFPAATKSGHIDHSTLKKQHHSALKASGLRAFLLYSLRHSFATKIAPRVDAWTLCKIMGWASLSVAMTYVHANEQQVLEVFSGHAFGHVVGGDEISEIPPLAQAIDSRHGYLVSAAGFEPATHALKGHCSTT
jgi:integrase